MRLKGLYFSDTTAFTRSFYKPNPRIVASSDSDRVGSFENTAKRSYGTNVARALHLFGKYFASVDGAWSRRFPGWRGGIAAFLALAILVLGLNVSTLIWAVVNLDQIPFATITTRSCESIDVWSSFIQTAISIFSALLLSGSNYSIQVLCSPTRAEVDEAHRKHTYLNIGVLSMRNIIRFRKRRLCLFILLVLSNMPLHFVYVSYI